MCATGGVARPFFVCVPWSREPTPFANGGVGSVPPTLRKKREGWGTPCVAAGRVAQAFAIDDHV